MESMSYKAEGLLLCNQAGVISQHDCTGERNYARCISMHQMSQQPGQVHDVHIPASPHILHRDSVDVRTLLSAGRQCLTV